ncbi:MAG: phospholipase D-like domain-containing protein [Vicinamibacterales bacterium]
MSLGKVGALPALVAGLLLTVAAQAAPLDRICDPAYENCRTPVLDLIRAETQGIDVAFWFMTDTRYANELIARFRAGVPVRVIVDTDATPGQPLNGTVIQMLRDAGIPIRNKTIGGILHWKAMIFVGQNTVEFSGANYSADAFVPVTPYANYVDEVIYFTDTSSIVNSFKTKFDDQWVSTDGYVNYANVTTPTRRYPVFPIDPELNFPPGNNFASRSVGRYNAETQGIDAIIYRITDRRHTDALIAARGRGIPIRLISEPLQYRDVTRLWHSWNIDRLYMAGVQVRHREHAGLTHEKLTLLRGQGMVVFGSSNWTSASASSQAEHNLFTTDATFYNWATTHFERKWFNLAPGGIQETQAFTPLPPDTPSLRSPANGATEQPTAVILRWYAGPWAHKYDVFFGTDPGNLSKIVDDNELGPSEHSNDFITWNVSNLASGTTYYWRITSRTMANQARTSSTFSFTTSGTPGGGGGSLPSGWLSTDVGSVSAAGSASDSSGTFTVRGSGSDIWGNADELHFAYQTMVGDGTITARVASVQNVHAWTKAGVMIRASTSAGAAHGMMMVTPGKGLAYQRRTSSGGATTHSGGAAATAPYWVRLTRTGNTVRAYQSTNGSTWTLVGSDTIALGATALVGLAVSSHVDGTLATATFTSVSLTSGGSSGGSLPTGWEDGDVGGVGAAGSASQASGVFTVQGSGADIWGAADEFHFAYRTLTGDGTITARVSSLQNVNAWTKAGVMMRASLGANSAHAMMLVSAQRGLAYQRRPATGAATDHTGGATATAPYWVRIVRSGNAISAYQSANGTSWALVDTATISLPGTVLVGLAVTSHADGSLATATFDSVAVTP